MNNDDIYKGENRDEDISSWDKDDIWDHLKDKIYDSTITIVLISPNIKELGMWQKSQWIPNKPLALTHYEYFHWLAGVYFLATNWLQNISERIKNSYNM